MEKETDCYIQYEDGTIKMIENTYVLKFDIKKD